METIEAAGGALPPPPVPPRSVAEEDKGSKQPVAPDSHSPSAERSAATAAAPGPAAVAQVNLTALSRLNVELAGSGPSTAQVAGVLYQVIKAVNGHVIHTLEFPPLPPPPPPNAVGPTSVDAAA